MTGFTFLGRGAFTPAATLTTLASISNPVAASLNMLNWTGHDGKQSIGVRTDFSATNVATPGVSNTNLWKGVGATITTINGPAFDGTPQYNKLVESALNTTHFVRCNDGNPFSDCFAYNPITWRLMVIAAAAERTRIVLSNFADDTSDIFTWSLGFDLVGGNTNYDALHGSQFNVPVGSMISLGTVGGLNWWACIADFSYNTANTGTGVHGSPFPGYQLAILLDNGSGTAARSATYTGNGSSGAYVFMMHMLPKAVWTHNWTQNFTEEFANINTAVDINNTKVAGFSFYPDMDYPNSSPTNFGHPKATTAAAAFTQPMASVLQIQSTSQFVNDNSFDTHAGAASVVYTSGTGLGSLTGRYWGPPAVFDYYWSYDGPYFQGDHISGGQFSDFLNDISFWSSTAEALVGTGLDGSGHFVQFSPIDQNLVQNAAGGGGPAEIDNTGSFTGGTGFTSCGMVNQLSPKLGNFHRTTGLWLDANGSTGVVGWGLYMGFGSGTSFASDPNYESTYRDGMGGSQNGSAVCGVAYGPSIFTHPAGLTNRSGALSPNDTLHFMIYLWSSAVASGAKFGNLGVRTWLDWVTVWQ